MVDLLVLVILVSIFFGISLTSALHGILGSLGAVIVIGIVLSLICSDFMSSNTSSQPAQKATPRTEIKDKPKKKHPILVWSTFFIISYFISLMFLVATGIDEGTEYMRNGGRWLKFVLPIIPFIIVFIISLVFKYKSKKRTKKQ